MKVAPIITDNGTKETGETLLVISLHEGAMIVEAIEMLHARHKRRGAVRRLLSDAQNIPVA